jgi:hypothetical protein
VVNIIGPPSGAVYPVGTPVSFNGTFSDNAGGTHTAEWLVDNFAVAGTPNRGRLNEAHGQISATATFQQSRSLSVEVDRH